MNIRFILGGVFILIGVIFFSLSGYLLSHSIENSHNLNDRLSKIEASCQKQLTKLVGEKGKIKTLSGGVIEIQFPETNDIRSELGDATAIAAICPNRTIVDACVGVGCAIPSTKLPLVIIKLKVAL